MDTWMPFEVVSQSEQLSGNSMFNTGASVISARFQVLSCAKGLANGMTF